MSAARGCRAARVFAVIGVVGLMIVAGAGRAVAEVPGVVDFQGTLADDTGVPLTGQATLIFSLYAAATGGDPVWQETQAVTVNAGIYSIALGSVTPFPGTLWENPALWLGIRQEGAAELPQRVRIVAVPYALRAKTAESLADGGRALPAGAMVLSDRRNDPDLLAAGFAQVCPFRPECWEPTADANAPSGRADHTAVPAGNLMIIWGGHDGDSCLNTGGVYDTVSGTWHPTSTAGAPSPRLGHTAVWTGSRMIIWGGWQNGVGNFTDGAAYDPTSDTWTPISTASAPGARYRHTAVWTGTHMIVWGGVTWDDTLAHRLDTGGVYDPAADAWSSTATAGAPAARSEHTAVWTGDRMIVWGGAGSGYLRSGAAYDPTSNTWSPASTLNAPTGRSGHAAVWTGRHMVVWGGEDGLSTGKANTGGVYDPATDAWSATAVGGAPTARVSHTAVWTGDRVVVWGGRDDAGPGSQTGAAYDPVTDSWVPMPLAGAPSPRYGHTAVWTARYMLVWGGLAGEGAGTVRLGSGAMYNPAADRLFYAFRRP